MPTLNIKLRVGDQDLLFDTQVRGRVRVGDLTHYSQDTIDKAGYQHFTDEAGAVSIELLPVGLYRVWPLAEGYRVAGEDGTESFDLELIAGENPQQVVQLERLAGAAPSRLPNAAPSRLHRDGVDLRNEQGQIVRLEGATFFAAYWLFLERGADAIRPSLAQLRDRYRVNLVVLFGMSVNVQGNLFGAPPFDPARYGPGYLQQLPAFMRLCAEYGMYVYWIAFPDHGIISAYDQEPKCVALWNPLLDVFRAEPNILLKPTNEGGVKGYNYINPHALAFPDFCPVAAVDYGVEDPAWSSGSLPAGSDWGGDRSCGDLHPPREFPAAVMDCSVMNNIYYLRNRAVFISEAIRLGSNGSGGVTRERARLVGLASRVGPAMRVFHSLQGEKCEVFDDVTRDHADAYFTGV